MKASGRKIKSTVKEHKDFRMDLFIVVNTSKESLMVMEDINGQVDNNMKGNGEMAKGMEMEPGLERKVIFTKANGALENLRDLVRTHQQIMTFMRVNLSNLFDMGKEYKNLLTEICIAEIILMGNHLEQETITGRMAVILRGIF